MLFELHSSMRARNVYVPRVCGFLPAAPLFPSLPVTTSTHPVPPDPLPPFLSCSATLPVCSPSNDCPPTQFN